MNTKRANTKKNEKQSTKIIKYIGSVLSVASIAFVIWYILKMDVDFVVLAQPEVIADILLCGLVLGVAVFIYALAWKTILEMFSRRRIPAKSIFQVYGKANLAKYIPGNFMHYASRNIVGRRYEISQQHMVVATILEILLLVFTGLAMVLLMAFDGLRLTISSALQEGTLQKEWLIVVGVAIAGAIIGVVLYMKRHNYLSDMKWKNVLYSVGFYIAALLINAFTFLVTVWIVAPKVLIENPLSLCGYYLIAWLIGFVTPGAPGGIGIREYIMLLLMAPILGSETVSLVMIITRIFGVIGDVIVYLYAIILDKQLIKKGAT